MDKKALEKLSPAELVTLAEKDTSQFKHDRYYPYQLACGKYDAEGKADEANNMKMEVIALQFFTDSSERRFTPMWTTSAEDSSQKREYPDLEKDLTDETIEYYEKRAMSTPNPILKARYSDLVWEKKRRHTYGREAITAYLSCCPLYLNNRWGRELVDALRRAMALSCMLSDRDLIDKCMEQNIAAIRQMKDRRMSTDIAAIVDVTRENAGKCSKPIDFEQLLEICELAIQDIGENETDGFMFQRGILEAMGGIFKTQSKDAEAKQTRVRIAESFVDEGDWKKTNYPSGNLVAAAFYANALKEYMNIGGFDDRVTEIKMKMAEANKKGIATELKPIVSEVDVPIAPFEKRMNIYEGKNIGEILSMISADKALLQSYDIAADSAKRLTKENPLWGMMPLAVMRGNIQVKIIAGDQSIIEFHTLQNIQIYYRTVAARLLTMLFQLMETKGTDYLEHVEQFLGKAEMISAERLSIIKHGLRAYGNEEYVAAFHILIFQIEGILRDFVGILGLPTFSIKTGKSEMRERQLDDILNTLGQVPGFDKDLAKFLEVYLCRIEADNYRNEAAHGLLPVEAFTKENCQLLIMCLIKLQPYTIVKPQDDKA